MPPVANKSPKVKRIVAFLLFGSATLTLAAAGWFYHLSEQKLAGWTETDARVVALVEKRRSSGGRRSSTSTSYSPRFEFTAKDGRSYTVTSGASSNPPSFEVGEQLRVLYPEDAPAEAVEKTFLGLWLLPLGVAVMGLGEASLAFFMLWMARRGEKKSLLN